VLTLTFAASPSQAAVDEDYAAGCQHYQQRDYETARVNFGQAVLNNPLNWQARYQLGNTCLQLQDYEAARKSYLACLTLKPSPEVAKGCMTALKFCGGAPTDTAAIVSRPPESKAQTKKDGEHQKLAAKSVGAAKPADAQPADVGAIPPPPPCQAERTAQAQQAFAKQAQQRQDQADAQFKDQQKRILTKAEQEADTIRKQGKSDAADAEANGNQWYVDLNDGTVFHGAARGTSKEIIRQAEEKAQQVMDRAKKDAEAIMPVKLDSISSDLARQIGPDDKFGLNPDISNIYVRNYNQPAK